MVRLFYGSHEFLMKTTCGYRKSTMEMSLSSPVLQNFSSIFLDLSHLHLCQGLFGDFLSQFSAINASLTVKFCLRRLCFTAESVFQQRFSFDHLSIMNSSSHILRKGIKDDSNAIPEFYHRVSKNRSYLYYSHFVRKLFTFL